MEKDFQKWHAVKATIHDNAERPLFHEREIWWCSVGVNVGFEEDGKNEAFERPVLIFRKFNKEIFWELPITTKEKTGLYYFSYEHGGKIFSIIVSQLRLLDGKRLLRKIYVLPKKDFQKLEEKFSEFVKQTIPPIKAGSRRPKPFVYLE